MGRYRTTMKDLLEKVYKEDGHQDVSSSKRMCRTIVEDAQQIESKLNTMSPEDSLDTWWTNKLAVSANNLNKARDFNTVNAGIATFEIGNFARITNLFGTPDISEISGESTAYKTLGLFDTETSTRGSAS